MNISISMLRSVDLFAGLEPEQIEALVAIGSTPVFHQGDVILTKGDQTTEVYVIMKGQVEVIAELAEDAISMVILGAGQSFGEMALLDAGPRSASIRCVSPEAEILEFSRDALMEFWNKECRVGFQMMSNIARDLAFKLRIRNLTCEMAGEEANL